MLTETGPSPGSESRSSVLARNGFGNTMASLTSVAGTGCLATGGANGISSYPSVSDSARTPSEELVNPASAPEPCDPA
jgi:hypothetical protein